MARAIQTKLQQRQAHEAKIEALLHPPRAPDILNAAMAAMKGEPHPRDPWNFNSVLENQAGSEQAERFIAIIRKTRRSNIVENRDAVKAVWALCGMPWYRTLDTWDGRGKTADTRFKSLAAHLTCKYRMPEFLFSVFFVPEDNARFVEAAMVPRHNRNQMLVLYRHLVGGGSVKAAVQEGMLPVPLTKRMCHEFMQGPRKGDVYTAIRYAQTKASGGSESLARALAATPLGRGIFDAETEARLLTVIEWFSRQGMLNPDMVGPLYDYIEHRMHELDFVITGRAVAAMQRGMEEWHAAMNQAGRFRHVPANYSVAGRNPPEKFAPSGFTSEVFEVNEVLWSVEEILTWGGLTAEGSVMDHCVASYWYRIETGRTSIWSLQRESHRQLTIEVDNSTRTIVQARAAHNHRATSEQSRMLAHWAAKNNLRTSL